MELIFFFRLLCIKCFQIQNYNTVQVSPLFFIKKLEITFDKSSCPNRGWSTGQSFFLAHVRLGDGTIFNRLLGERDEGKRECAVPAVITDSPFLNSTRVIQSRMVRDG